MPLPRPEGDDLYDWLEYDAASRSGYYRDSRGRGRIRPGRASKYTRTDYLFNEGQLRNTYGLGSQSLYNDIEEFLGMSPLEILPQSSDRYEYFQDEDFYRNGSGRYLDRDRLIDNERFDIEGDPVFNGRGVYVPPGDPNRPYTGPAYGPTKWRDPVTGKLMQYTSQGMPAANDVNKEIPTKTTNPLRPRTVAAIWEAQNQLLTVVFRDGTFYNYYGVSIQEWRAFKQSPSKGRYILEVLDSKSRGPADMSDMPVDVAEFLYRAARTAQARMHAESFTAPAAKRPYYNYKKASLTGSYTSWSKAGKPGGTWENWVKMKERELSKKGHSKLGMQSRAPKRRKK